MMVIFIKRPKALWADVLDVYRGIGPAHGKMCKPQADAMQAICTRGQDLGKANAVTLHIIVVVILRPKRCYLKDNLRPCVSGQIHPVLCVGLKQRIEHSAQPRFEALQDLFLKARSHEWGCFGVVPLIEPLPQSLAVSVRDEAEEAEAQLARAIPLGPLCLENVAPDDRVEVERHVRAGVAVGKTFKTEVVQADIVHVALVVFHARFVFYILSVILD
jgi:hypothetical protein